MFELGVTRSGSKAEQIYSMTTPSVECSGYFATVSVADAESHHATQHNKVEQHKQLAITFTFFIIIDISL
jgi:hypothetical protein